MKNIFKHIIQNLALFFVLAGLFTFTSCEDEDPMNTDEVVLLSFGPSGVVHGDEIIFVGQNMDKVSSVVLKPEITIEKSEFVDASKESFKVIVPQGAEAGKVMLNTPDGQVESKTILNFLVDVKISSIPEEAKPGTDISIKGEKVNWIESVTFSSDVTVEKEDFVSQSLSELIITVPMEAQSGFLIFSTGGTEPLTFGSEEELVVTLPEVSSLNPVSLRHESDLTISGADLDLVTEMIFGNDISVLKADFVSQSETEIVVTIPSPVETGTITLKQLSPIDVVTTEELSIILPAAENVDPSPAVPGEDNITITGTDLDLISELILSGSGSISSGNFISQSATEIVLAVPEDASQGGISYVTIHGYANSLGVVLELPGAGPAPLIATVFDDATSASFDQGGGWNGTTTDFENTENPRVGSVSVKATYSGEGGGAAQFGQWNGQTPIDVSGSEVFIFSIYGGTGTDGNTLNVALNGEEVPITITEGEWVDVEMPLSNFSGLSGTVNEIWFGDVGGWSGVVYFDHIGFGLPSGPAPLNTIVFDDATSASFDQGGGWNGTTTDFENTENPREGSVSVKATYSGEGGGAAQFGQWNGQTPIDVSTSSVFAFSIYGGTGTDGNTLNVALNGEEVPITITEGEWVDVEMSLGDFSGLSGTVNEIWFGDVGGWSGDIYIDYVGFR